MPERGPIYPQRRTRAQAIRPRRVRGGIRLSGRGGELPRGWAAQRWLGFVEGAARPEARSEGLEYARAGQTRRLGIDEGKVEGLVQGRLESAYKTTLRLDRFAADDWEAAIEAMTDQAIYAAKLLSGELPPEIEEMFGSAGLRLFPVGGDEVRTNCTCAYRGQWCKHAVCVALLLADRLESEPFVIFALRGMSGDELLERIRQRRQMAGAGGGIAVPVYASHVPELDTSPTPSLEESIDAFWEAGPELDQIDLPLEPPSVRHPLLRRLGQSPFPTSRFPLMGLLATCYELISESAIRGDQPEAPAAGVGGEDEGSEPLGSPEATEDARL